MKRKYLVAAGIILAVVALLGGVKSLQIQKLIAGAKAYTEPPETVSTAVARQDSWQGSLAAIGSINAVQGVMVTPDLPGTVREIAFESGALVNKGDLLLRLDTSSEEAQLRAVEAQLELAKVNLERVRKLRADNAISQAELDTAEATLKEIQANADVIRATIEKKTVRAPFTGRLGLRLVNLGEYLEAGKPIVSLQSLDPVYAVFSLPQRDLSQLKTGLRVRLTTDAYPGREFEGKLTAINPDLDSSTRSVALQATLENRDNLLRPGMFARAEVLMPQETSVLIIPATSVLSAPYGDSVYVVETKEEANGKPVLTVRQQFIRTGPMRGDFVSVETGLKPGDRVVSSGTFKLRNGMTVVENNELKPSSNLAPKPADS